MSKTKLPLSLILGVCTLLSACGGQSPSTEATAGATPPTAPTAAVAPTETGPAVPASGTIIDVRPLVGQPEAGAQAMLGEPLDCKTVPQGRKCSYARAKTDIVFINGMADWITIGDLGGSPFAPATLTRIGLGEEPPASANANAIQWEDISGMREIRLLPEGDRAASIQIKAMTL